MRQQPDKKVQPQIKRLSNWIRLLTIGYRTLVLLGLALLILAILLLALTSRFSAWILIFPGLLIGLGILLAWIEYRLDNRRFQLTDRPSGDEIEKS